MRPLRLAVMTAACLSFLASGALAVKTEHWKHEQPKDFLAGTLKEVVVSSLGEVMLGRDARVLQALQDHAEVVNALARAGDGKIYAATGPGGRIYQIDGEQVIEFARLPHQGTILSLVFAADGQLLAGTGGGSQAGIYRVDGAGQVNLLYEPPGARYIWALVRGADGEIYAATGTDGELHRVEPDGSSGRVLAKVRPKNLLCLVIGTNGLLYAGTDENGLIYRIDPATGSTFVLYDAKEAEISAIVIDDEGNLYASTASAEGARPGRAVADKPGGTPDPTPEATPADASEDDAVQAGEDEAPAPEAAAETRPANQTSPASSLGRAVAARGGGGGESGNAIYRIDTGGFVTEVFREPVMILALVEHQGTLFAATGNEGRIYSISPAQDRTCVVAKLEPSQVTAMLRLPDGGLVVGTANAASVVHIPDQHAGKGTLVSQPLDAGQVVKWGRLRVTAETPPGTTVTVATRSSNVQDEESDAWAEWSEEMDVGRSQQVPSPSARFLQYRFTLATAREQSTPVLRGIEIPRVEENRAPQVTSLEVVSAREEAQKPTASAAVKALVGAAGFGGQTQPGPQEHWVVKWKAEDPNQDTTVYDVFYREVGSLRWVQMGKDVKEPLQIWDTRTVPDGRYEIRVVARDTPSNPPGTDLSGARISDVVIVDNTPPDATIERLDVQGRRATVHAVLQDASTPLAEAAYSLNSDEEWMMLAADDDIFDSRNETVTFTVNDLEPGENRIALRVRDGQGNTRYVSRSVTVD